MAQSGWALIVFGLAPFLLIVNALPLSAVVGDSMFWLILAALGIWPLALALLPTDARAIRAVCAVLFALFPALGLASLVLPPHTGIPLAAIIFTIVAGLGPTLRCRGPRSMPPRLALRRLWLTLRVGLFAVATFLFINVIQNRDLLLFEFGYVAVLAIGASLAVPALFLTSANRGRIHRRLGRLGGRGSEEEEAAAVSALVAGADPEKVLANATTLFRCLPVNNLFAADLADNTDAPANGPTLHERTQAAVIGEVTAFLSHSWSDEREAPGAKFGVVARWAQHHKEKTGEEPTIWLDKAALLRSPHPWSLLGSPCMWADTDCPVWPVYCPSTIHTPVL